MNVYSGQLFSLYLTDQSRIDHQLESINGLDTELCCVAQGWSFFNQWIKDTEVIFLCSCSYLPVNRCSVYSMGKG